MIVSPLQHLDCERSFSFLFYVLGFSGDASMLPKVPIAIIPLAGYQSSNLFVTLSLVRHVPGNDHYQDETEMWRTVEHSVKFQGRLNVINDQKSIQFSVSVYSIRMPNPKQVMEFVWLSMANEMWKKTSLIRRFLCRCLFFLFCGPSSLSANQSVWGAKAAKGKKCWRALHPADTHTLFHPFISPPLFSPTRLWVLHGHKYQFPLLRAGLTKMLKNNSDKRNKWVALDVQ